MKKIKLVTLLHYILIYAFIVVHGAVMYSLYELSYLSQLIIIIFCILIIMIKRIGIPRRIIVFPFVIALFTLLVRLMNDGGIGPKLILDTTVSYLIVFTVYNFNKEKFATRFVKTLLFISIISLVCFSLMQINMPLLLKILGNGYNFHGIKMPYYGKIFYVYKSGDPRNVGIFYEPGVFQTILTGTLFYILFYSDKLQINNKIRSFSVIVFTITLLTTQSTTGYIGVALIYIAYLFYKDKSVEDLKILKNIKRIVVVVIICFIAFIIHDLNKNGDEGLISTIVLDKISNINGGDTYTGLHVSSGQARLLTIQLSLELFLQNPLGNGYEKFDAFEKSEFGGGVTGGAILFKHLATAGIIIYLITLFMVFGSTYKNRKNNYVFWVFVLLYINITIAQSNMLYPIMLLASEIAYDRRFRNPQQIMSRSD